MYTEAMNNSSVANRLTRLVKVRDETHREMRWTTFNPDEAPKGLLQLLLASFPQLSVPLLFGIQDRGGFIFMQNYLLLLYLADGTPDNGPDFRVRCGYACLAYWSSACCWNRGTRCQGRGIHCRHLGTRKPLWPAPEPG
jgi:hypothetical protein